MIYAGTWCVCGVRTTLKPTILLQSEFGSHWWRRQRRRRRLCDFMNLFICWFANTSYSHLRQMWFGSDSDAGRDGIATRHGDFWSHDSIPSTGCEWASECSRDATPICNNISIVISNRCANSYKRNERSARTVTKGHSVLVLWHIIIALHRWSAKTKMLLFQPGSVLGEEMPLNLLYAKLGPLFRFPVTEPGLFNYPGETLSISISFLDRIGSLAVLGS